MLNQHCRNCDEKRDFVLITEDAFEDTYECPECKLNSKQKTPLGYVMSGASLAFWIIGAVVGIDKVNKGNKDT